MLFLPPEDPAEITATEAQFRKILAVLHRFTWAVFLSWQINDFLYSPLWMHGYVWCLNLPVDTNMAEISAGPLVIQQLRAVGEYERILHDVLKVISVAMMLFCSGFYTKPQSVKKLWNLSCAVGLVIFFVRSLQMQQRLFPSLHEAFSTQAAFFIIGVVLTIQAKDRFPAVKFEKTDELAVEEEIEETATLDDSKKIDDLVNNNHNNNNKDTVADLNSRSEPRLKAE